MHEEVTLQWSERIQSIPAEQPLYADNCYVAILFICFFFIMAAFIGKENAFAKIFNEFFLPRKNTGEGVKTAGSFYIQLGLLCNTFITTALFFAIYIMRGSGYETKQGYQLLAFFFVAAAAVYWLKQGIYGALNWVFFDKSQMNIWLHCYADWTIISGISMYLVLLLSVFFDLCLTTMTILLIIHMLLTETCLFFKAFHIFLVKKYGSLQLIVYLCTLEIMPLLMAGKALTQYL